MAASNDRKKDEIDLIELFRRAGWTLTRWIKALGRGILIRIVFLFRKWIPLTISLLIGAGACYIMKKSFTPYYSSELTIKSNTISNADMIPYLNRLHFFCRENNKQAIASDLSVPQNIAEKPPSSHHCMKLAVTGSRELVLPCQREDSKLWTWNHTSLRKRPKVAHRKKVYR